MKRILLALTIIFLAIFVFSNTVFALENTMSLLAVKETKNGLEGSLAQLNLEIINGKGRVLLETHPLTKSDTQVSTRIAQEIACNYLEVDCSNLDFIYTIVSDSSIIGGPSAGSAMAIITIATLKELKLDKSVIITGTINSGNLIGPVGGIKEKIEIAEKKGFSKILIPVGEMIDLNNNESINLTKFKEDKKIEIIEVYDLDSALYEFTGVRLRNVSNKNLEINKEYSLIMERVSNRICERTFEMLNFISDSEEFEKYINLTQELKDLYHQKDYYSRASRCFSNNIQLRYYINKERNFILKEEINELFNEIETFDEELNNKKIDSVPKLQTYIVVKERLNDAKKNNQEALTSSILSRDDAIYLYSYSYERFDSAKVWSLFFEKGGDEIDLNKDLLSEACFKKIQEANSRIQYLNSITNMELESLNDYLNHARTEYSNGEYALCINYASLGKANADNIIGGYGLKNESELKDIINIKLNIAKQIIIEQQEKGLFPILGYSYYEYSKNLMNQSIYSSMLFSQYALELSDFSLYLEKKNHNKIYIDQGVPKTTEKYKANHELFIVYSIGFITGGIVAFMLYRAIRI